MEFDDHVTLNLSKRTMRVFCCREHGSYQLRDAFTIRRGWDGHLDQPQHADLALLVAAFQGEDIAGGLAPLTVEFLRT